MTYQKIYDSLIARARARKLEGYCEKHHVIPRCMGGDNSKYNLVKLTAEEHFIAHQLLAKLHPDVEGLIVAIVLLSRLGTTSIHNKSYGWIKRRISAAKTGKKHSEATKKLISEKKKGTPSPNKGKPVSQEQKRKISVANTGKRSPNKGKPMSQEQKDKLALANIGKTQSDATKAKRSKAMKGKIFGPPTQETRDKIAATLRGRKISPEIRAKQSESLKKTLAKKRDRREILAIWQAM